MKKRKGFSDLAPLMLLWLMLSVLIWGWIFTFLTDTAPENKIVLFADAVTPGAEDMALALEEHLAEGIQMVKVYPFTRAMMNGDELEGADLFIVGASKVEVYRELFRPLPEEMLEAGDILKIEGQPLGVKIFDQASGKGGAGRYITYLNEYGEPEDFYLFFGAKSLHVAGNEQAVDHQAVKFAQLIMNMD